MQRAGFTKAATVTQSDVTDCAAPFTTKAIYCGGASAANLSVILVGGQTATLTNVQPGTLLPLAVRRVKDTGTTFADADLLLLGD